MPISRKIVNWVFRGPDGFLQIEVAKSASHHISQDKIVGDKSVLDSYLEAGLRFTQSGGFLPIIGYTISHGHGPRVGSRHSMFRE